MENYSIFSSSTNSSTSSPTNSNFPFSLSQVSSTSNNSFDHHHDLHHHHHVVDHYHDHHDGNQSQPLMMGDQHQIQVPNMVVHHQSHLMNNYHDDHHGITHNYHEDNNNNDDQNKRINMVNDHHNSNNNKMIKKGSMEKKKVKKHRYAFQTRSQVDILDDGYRWRKYGQKAVKNNKFPRSYYRCTYQGCNVKKQVQRLSNDEAVVVTTYEGIHSHSIERSTDNFEHILTQMQIYNSF
ncbi:hypothetical protein BVRB_6g150450 [Beta vulgaris subsp. vulgaris]|nr:hypothetical protein BVRB_6g150450 [Beta vulgaris subsp. vulgaris]